MLLVRRRCDSFVDPALPKLPSSRSTVFRLLSAGRLPRLRGVNKQMRDTSVEDLNLVNNILLINFSIEERCALKTFTLETFT